MTDRAGPRPAIRPSLTVLLRTLEGEMTDRAGSRPAIHLSLTVLLRTLEDER